MVTTTFGSGDILLWMLEFFLFVIWFWLLIGIFSDLFRDRTTGGGVKALWVVLLILLPFLGILLYLIFRGKGMGERGAQQAAEAREMFDAQVRRSAGVVRVARRPDHQGQGAARLRRDRPGRVRQAQGRRPGLSITWAG